jgi:hypothetical protein
MYFFACPHVAEEVRKLFGVFLIPSRYYHLPIPLLPNATALDIGLVMNLGRYKHSLLAST